MSEIAKKIGGARKEKEPEKPELVSMYQIYLVEGSDPITALNFSKAESVKTYFPDYACTFLDGDHWKVSYNNGSEELVIAESYSNEYELADIIYRKLI